MAVVTIAGRHRLADAMLSMGRAFFELGAALEKLDDPGSVDSLMRAMDREAAGRPKQTMNGVKQP